MTGAAPAALTCAAGCGTALHPAAAAGGNTTHPGCDPAARPPAGRRVIRWACLACGANGPADTPTLAVHFGWVHDVFACPAAPAINAEERALRIARRRDLTACYPDQAPPWPRVHPDRRGGTPCPTLQPAVSRPSGSRRRSVSTAVTARR